VYTRYPAKEETMKRVAVLAALAVGALGLPTGAAAKEIASIEICGAAGCKTVTERVDPDVMDGEPYAHPPAASSFYSLRMTAKEGDKTFSWTIYYVPSGYLRGIDERGDSNWMKLYPEGAAVLRSLSENVEPFAKPVVTYARVGKRVARDPASYLRLYEIRSAGFHSLGRPDWIRIVLRSPQPSPWTDGRNDLQYSPSTRLLLRDGEYVLLSKPLAKRVVRGLSLSASSGPQVALKAGIAGLGALAFLGLIVVRRRQ
jgi:hypothetical protein